MLHRWRRASSSAHTGFALNALEQALHDRQPARDGGLIHHGDRGVQYVSIYHTERLTGVGSEASEGSIGHSYDNALAATINGLYKAEVIRPQSRKRREGFELAALTCIDCFNLRVAGSYRLYSTR